MRFLTVQNIIVRICVQNWLEKYLQIPENKEKWKKKIMVEQCREKLVANDENPDDYFFKHEGSRWLM